MTLYPQETCVQFYITNALGVYIRTTSGKLSRNFDDVADSVPGKGLWYREWNPILETYLAERNVSYDMYDIYSIPFVITCPDVIIPPPPPPPPTQNAAIGWILGIGVAVGGVYYWMKNRKKWR